VYSTYSFLLLTVAAACYNHPVSLTTASDTPIDNSNLQRFNLTQLEQHGTGNAFTVLLGHLAQSEQPCLT